MSSVHTHWCYHCSAPICPENSVCPYCHGGFIQELHDIAASPSGNEPGTESSIMSAFAAYMRQIMATAQPHLHVRPRPGMIPERSVGEGVGPGPPAHFLVYHGYPPVGVPVQDPSGYSGPWMGQQHADYHNFLAEHTLPELIEQTSTNERHGPPPAPRSAIDALPTIRISQRHLNTDAHCPVCQEKFRLGSEARKMPCDHIYHSECIVTWLVEHNSCPVCRSELPPTGSGNARAGNPSSTRARSGRRDRDSRNQGSCNPFSFLRRSHS
ncbi:probable E3 ubiquitin-protein ligase RHC1A [Sesamum indicum]|uniref:RING-type E3 ubiquitin transferase n=1 Tax=Sesamum indicum TaxID=4182 RepID=A0A6I9T8D8_SESIN|nr:probable E3 ubiquitin-protein ligase RHC1A [Sesamum indicum]